MLSRSEAPWYENAPSLQRNKRSYTRSHSSKWGVNVMTYSYITVDTVCRVVLLYHQSQTATDLHSLSYEAWPDKNKPEAHEVSVHPTLKATESAETKVPDWDHRQSWQEGTEVRWEGSAVNQQTVNNGPSNGKDGKQIETQKETKSTCPVMLAVCRKRWRGEWGETRDFQWG